MNIAAALTLQTLPFAGIVLAGVFAAQEIKPQARVLAEDRGIRCLVLDYDDMKGIESGIPRLF